MRPSIVTVLTAAGLLTLTSALAGGEHVSRVDAKAAFEKIKGLAGE